MTSNTSPEAMDRMIRNITKCIDLQDKLIASLKSDYSTVGEEWNDKQYINLGNAINNIISKVNGNKAELSETVSKLQVLKSALIDYLEIKI